MSAQTFAFCQYIYMAAPFIHREKLVKLMEKHLDDSF